MSLSNLQRNIRNGDARFRWTFVNFLYDSLYHSSPSSLALQSDLGRLWFCSHFLRNRFIIRVSWKIIIPVFVTAVTGVAGFLAIFISKDGRAFLHQIGMPTYQINRILAWLNPFEFAQTTTYQQAQGQIAIGSGGLFGQGFNASNLLIPVRESDMILRLLQKILALLALSWLLPSISC